MLEGHRERLIGKALKHGLESFREHEILELYLFSLIPRVNTNPIAHALIKQFGSLYNVFNATVDELIKIKGIGKRTAQQIILFPHIARAYQISIYGEKLHFSDLSQIGQYCVELFTGRVNEAMHIICLDAKNRVIKNAIVAEGTPSEVYVEPRQIIEHVSHTATSSVVLCHNHPGGTLMPSQNDIETTQKIKIALDAIGIKLIDHIIVAKGRYISTNVNNLTF
ncbi:MAG: hypothetical protein BWY15_01431 [Firmicutes bacterium ADurb.Bin193]|nr:MAG: hypothetical protein BWY15_01431 [Firmicutes bacterium ADurb.Bin193]